MMDKIPKTMQDQLGSIYPEAATRVKQMDPKEVITITTDKVGITVRRATASSFVVSEAQLYYLISALMTKEGTDSLWHVRTPSRSGRGELLILHNPKAFQVLIDPLAVCRNGMIEFNKRGKLHLQCFQSRRGYCAVREDDSMIEASQGRTQPIVILNDPQQTETPSVQENENTEGEISPKT